MEEKGTTNKSAKAKPGPQESGVLGALPATRPSRLGRHSRGESAAPAATKVKAKKRAPKKPAARKPATAATQPKGNGGEPTTITDAPRSRPRPVRAGARNLAESAAKSSARRAPARPKAPSGTE